MAHGSEGDGARRQKETGDQAETLILAAALVINIGRLSYFAGCFPPFPFIFLLCFICVCDLAIWRMDRWIWWLTYPVVQWFAGWAGTHFHGLSVGSPQSKPPTANQNARPELTH